MINFRSVNDMNQLIKSKLHLIPDVDYIVGVPRSGMLPATLIALYLGKPLGTTEALGKYSFDTTRRITFGLGREIPAPYRTKILVVDDSCFTGYAINKIKEQCSRHLDMDFIYCAIYVTESSKNMVDFYFDVVEQWRVWEWNIMDHLILESSCVDLDGVLCIDPTPEQNDDANNYREFIRTAKPKFIPKHKIKAIVTCRLEKYRTETEKWLKAHNIQYEHLYMLDLPDKATRQKLNMYGKYKADIYKQTKAVLFIESSPKEAIEIHSITLKPVYCLSDGYFYKEET